MDKDGFLRDARKLQELMELSGVTEEEIPILISCGLDTKVVGCLSFLKIVQEVKERLSK